jgi:hypothetical protein
MKVKEIMIDNGKAIGVLLEDGKVIQVDGVVASNTDSRHLVLDLLGESQGGPMITDENWPDAGAISADCCKRFRATMLTGVMW